MRGGAHDGDAQLPAKFFKLLLGKTRPDEAAVVRIVELPEFLPAGMTAVSRCCIDRIAIRAGVHVWFPRLRRTLVGFYK